MNNRDLEIWVIGHSRSFKPIPFESFDAVSYSPSIVTVALSCIDKARYFSQIVIFSYPFHSTSPLWWSVSEYCHPVWYGDNKMVGLLEGENKLEDMCNRLERIPACDRRTDGQTSCHGIVRAMHTRRAVKMAVFRCTAAHGW